MQIDLSGKLHNKHVTGEPYILIGLDQYIKFPVVQICRSTETKEVMKFLGSFINFYSVPEKIKSDNGNAFIPKEYKMFCKNRNIEIKYSPPRLHTGTRAVECAIQTLKNLITANLEDKVGLTESVNRTLKIVSFTIHNGLKVSPFELHHGRKPRTELTNIIKDNKSYLSDWTTLNVSVPHKQIPKYVARNEVGEVTDHIIMVRKTKKPHAARHTNHRKESRQSWFVRTFNTHLHFSRKNRKNYWKGNRKDNRELP